MARKPVKQRKKKAEVDASIERVLLTGECEPGTPAHNLRINRFFDNGCELISVWKIHRQRLMKIWKTQHPRGLPWAEKEFLFYDRKQRGQDDNSA